MPDSKPGNGMPWEEWLQAVRDEFQNLGFGINIELDENAWREFYDDGYCPKDAVQEDLSNN